ncbi:hypothetical protein [Actinomadura sp. 9N215]|uniref:hypothetical protein n=1 Tax=Actinomadura sp. 9N215 TaxID=3375150 RepID=UPI00378DCAFB
MGREGQEAVDGGLRLANVARTAASTTALACLLRALILHGRATRPSPRRHDPSGRSPVAP